MLFQFLNNSHRHDYDYLLPFFLIRLNDLCYLNKNYCNDLFNMTYMIADIIDEIFVEFEREV